MYYFYFTLKDDEVRKPKSELEVAAMGTIFYFPELDWRGGNEKVWVFVMILPILIYHVHFGFYL